MGFCSAALGASGDRPRGSWVVATVRAAVVSIDRTAVVSINTMAYV